MDEIKIGAEIVFNITGNHNIGYAKGEKYIGTVMSWVPKGKAVDGSGWVISFTLSF